MKPSIRKLLESVSPSPLWERIRYPECAFCGAIFHSQLSGAKCINGHSTSYINQLLERSRKRMRAMDEEKVGDFFSAWRDTTISFTVWISLKGRARCTCWKCKETHTFITGLELRAWQREHRAKC